MTETFAEPEEANLDHLVFGHDPVISAFARWQDPTSGIAWRRGGTGMRGRIRCGGS
jgi:hypothetical protein